MNDLYGGNYIDLTKADSGTGGDVNWGDIGGDISNQNDLQQQLGDIESIAKGATQAIAFDDYSSVVSSLNNTEAGELGVGQNLYVRTLQVPDLWISETSQESQPYTYTTDEQFLTDLRTTGSLIIGYYIVSELETAKVDLTNYVEKTDYPTASTGGVVKTGNGFDTISSSSHEGVTYALTRSNTQYTTDADGFFISKGTLENLMETWTFTLENGTEVTKRVCVSPIGA